MSHTHYIYIYIYIYITMKGELEIINKVISLDLYEVLKNRTEAMLDNDYFNNITYRLNLFLMMFLL